MSSTGKVSTGKTTPRTDELTMKEMLAEQRKALRNFSSYYQMRGANN